MSKINPSIFKAYDIRGVYPEDINKDVAYKVGQAYVSYTGAHSVVVGRDMRRSSPELFDALVEGLTDMGADVVDIGLVATPEFYFAVAESEYEGGVMVTASHNPAKYNGLKMVRKDAMPIGGGSGMEDIKKLVLAHAPVKKPKGTVAETDVLEDYLDKIFSFVSPADIAPQLRIAIDTGNGMAGVIEPDLWKRFKNYMASLHSELDGSFPNHEPDPSKPENLKDLSAKVRATHADIGVAFEGDGDRVGFVDENGDPVRGDLVVALLAPEFLRKNPGATILADVRCSMAVRDEVERAGGTFAFSPVGHAPVKHQMRRDGAIFAGELSMHYYFHDFHYAECPDAVMLLVLKLMSEQKKKLSELITPLKRYYHSGEINFTVKDKVQAQKIVEEAFAPHATTVSYLDGVRMDFVKNGMTEWWFNVRPSNTEPLLRLNLEARTEEFMGEKKKLLTDLIISG